jgi:predicted RNA-binding protein with PIN domain
MRYLIDGYNLLYAWGLAPHGHGKGRLASARRNLLDRLRFLLGSRAAELTVVFDAARGPANGRPKQDYHGIRVHFALEGSADDCIEDLLRHEGKPHELTVVSDDHRLHQAAQHRQCHAQRCLDYIEQLQGRQPASVPAVRPEPSSKPEISSPEEAHRWLEEFGEADAESFGQP